MDGYFDYKGKKIDFLITDNRNSKINIINGVEKMSRYINFYDSSKNNIGGRNIYGNAEEMQNITPQKALIWYEEMLEM